MMTDMGKALPQERLHAMDAVRGFALLLGIVLHGTMSFMPGLIAAGWPIADNSPSNILGIFFYVIHIFRMAVFFMIAGFFAHFVFHRRGLRHFIRNRTTRILIPLLVSWLPVVVSIMVAVFWAASKLEGYQPPPDNREALIRFPLTHLWFLYVLLWIYTVSLLLRAAIVSFDRQQRLRRLIDQLFYRLIKSYLSPFVLAIPIAIILNAIPEWLWWSGIPTPDYSLDPNPYAFMIFLYLFIIGWFLDRQRRLLTLFQKQWVINLLLGTAATIGCLSIAGWDSTVIMQPALREQKLIYAGLYAVAVTALSIGITGAGMAFFCNENPVIRYRSDASYWMYIWHLPIIFIFQNLFMELALHWLIKFPLILVLTCIPLIISYDRLVRPTKIGEIMNGKRYPKGLPLRQDGS